jgi:hypothetical protein
LNIHVRAGIDVLAQARGVDTREDALHLVVGDAATFERVAHLGTVEFAVLEHRRQPAAGEDKEMPREAGLGGRSQCGHHSAQAGALEPDAPGIDARELSDQPMRATQVGYALPGAGFEELHGAAGIAAAFAVTGHVHHETVDALIGGRASDRARDEHAPIEDVQAEDGRSRSIRDVMSARSRIPLEDDSVVLGDSDRSRRGVAQRDVAPVLQSLESPR